MKRVAVIITLFIGLFFLGGCKFNVIKHDEYALRSPASMAELKSLVKKSNDRNIAIYTEDSQSPGNSALSGPAFTTTNVQVAGVDESDIVKNDGRYIYAVSGSAFTVVDTSDNETYVYEDPGFYPREMYLHDNYLIVIGTAVNSRYIIWDEYAHFYCRLDYFRVKVFDATDGSALLLLREVSLPFGSYISSRMIDNDIYFVLSAPCYDYKNEDVLLPVYEDSNLDDKVRQLSLRQIKVCRGLEDIWGYNILLSFDVTKYDDVNIEAYLGSFSYIYSSENNMYVANTIVKHNRPAYTETEQFYGDFYYVETLIYQFEIKDGAMRYRAHNTVPGSIFNEFSMDEYDGYFRIVTTKREGSSFWLADGNETSAYVLSLRDNLKIISFVGGIGVGEQVYSVRFEKERGYVVTFKNIDPLYIIDFSDPHNACVISELESPGVSDYLHKYNDNLLIGVGRDIQHGLVCGVKISLFDISDEENPVEADVFAISGTTTELRYNHKVFLDYRKLNIIAFPIYTRQEYGMYVFRIDEEKPSVSLIGIIADDYENMITRGVIINDYMYSISDKNIYVNDLNNDLTEVKVITIK